MQGLPFCVAGVGDFLALFRCISCRYCFGTDVQKPDLLGAPGRVYTTLTVRILGMQHALHPDFGFGSLAFVQSSMASQKESCIPHGMGWHLLLQSNSPGQAGLPKHPHHMQGIIGQNGRSTFSARARSCMLNAAGVTPLPSRMLTQGLGRTNDDEPQQHPHDVNT